MADDKDKRKDVVEVEDEDDVVTLVTESGEEIDFVEIAGIAHAGGFYAILQPVEPLPMMGEDDAIVFKVTSNEDGTDRFDIELDQEVIDAVYAEYQRLYDDATGGGNK